jgi:hypothetical protein
LGEIGTNMPHEQGTTEPPGPAGPAGAAGLAPWLVVTSRPGKYCTIA